MASREKNGWVYILREREFLKTNENIVKIGRTANKESRMKNYPKGSDFLECIEVHDTNLAENNLKYVFQEKFKVRNDIGSEYFEGDIDEMLKVFRETSTLQNNLNNTGAYIPHKRARCKCGYECRSDHMKYHEPKCTAKPIIEALEKKVNEIQVLETQNLKLENRNLKLQLANNKLKHTLKRLSLNFR